MIPQGSLPFGEGIRVETDIPLDPIARPPSVDFDPETGEVIPHPGKRLRRHLFELRATAGDLRPHHRDRCRVDEAGNVHPLPSSIRVCGIASNGAATTLGVRDAMGTAGVFGVQHCGNIWECAACAAVTSSERAREIVHAVNHARAAGRIVFLVTLTGRHDYGTDLERMRRGMSRSWTGILESRAWKSLRNRHGIHYVRRLEATHGANGWHPHLHLLIVADRSLENELVDLVKMRDPWREKVRADEAFRSWLFPRWIDAVDRFIGPEAVGDANHAVRVDRVASTDSAANYLAKLGLELTDAFARKTGRDGQRTPWGILGDIAAKKHGDAGSSSSEVEPHPFREGETVPVVGSEAHARDRELWREWIEKMKGAKQLTWSRGFRASVGLDDEESDEQILDRAAFDGRPVAIVPPEARGAILGRPHIVTAMLHAIEQAEGFIALERIARSNLRPEIAEAFVEANRDFDPAAVLEQYLAIRKAVEGDYRRQREALEARDAEQASEVRAVLRTPEGARAVWDFRIAEGQSRGLEAKAKRRARTWSPFLRTNATHNPEDFRDD